jgi:hypothetical protein
LLSLRSSLFGLVFIGLGSLGNGVESRSLWGPVLGFLAVSALVIPVYFLKEDVRGEYYLDNTSLIFGAFVMILHIFNFIVLCFRPETLMKYPFIKRVVRSSRLIDQKNLKKAAQIKINLMVKHALDVLGESQRENILGSHFGRGLHNFAANVDKMEPSGGFRWTWRKSKYLYLGCLREGETVQILTFVFLYNTFSYGQFRIL